jgi:2-furoyl-CoA dehydrogenase large subunit
MRLEVENDGTRLHYRYKVNLSGKIASVGSRLLEGAARVLIGTFFNALAHRAGGQAATTVDSWWRRLMRFLGLSS